MSLQAAAQPLGPLASALPHPPARESGGRATLNGEGAATAEEVLAAFEGGCSVRLSWPQRHSDTVWGLLASLEEHFGCGAGCNVHCTAQPGLRDRASSPETSLEVGLLHSGGQPGLRAALRRRRRLHSAGASLPRLTRD